MARSGMISPAAAAKKLGVHVNTMRAWCYRAEAGEPSPLHASEVEHNKLTGYWHVSLAEVLRLKRGEQLDDEANPDAAAERKAG